MAAPYVCYPDKKRVIIPSVIGVLLLCAVFYIAALINLSLLDIDLPLYGHVLIVAVLILFVVIQLLLSLKKAKSGYVFEQDGVRHGKKKIPYTRLGEVHIKQNPLDKMFRTGSVVTDMMIFDHVANPQQLARYVQQWERYAQQYQRY